jgi:hypothetical protein
MSIQRKSRSVASAIVMVLCVYPVTLFGAYCEARSVEAGGAYFSLLKKIAWEEQWTKDSSLRLNFGDRVLLAKTRDYRAYCIERWNECELFRLETGSGRLLPVNAIPADIPPSVSRWRVRAPGIRSIPKAAGGVVPHGVGGLSVGGIPDPVPTLPPVPEASTELSLEDCEVHDIKAVRSAGQVGRSADSATIVSQLLQSFNRQGLTPTAGEVLIPAFEPTDRFVYVGFRFGGEETVLLVWLDPEERGRLAPVSSAETRRLFPQIESNIAYRVPIAAR